MNIVVFATYAINTPHFETELELAHTHADKGDHVTILTCGGELESCDPNPYHDAPRCAKCMGKRDCGLKLIPPSIVTESFYQLTDEDRHELDQLQTQYDSHEALKKLTIGGFDIGFAVLSSLITKMRDPEVDLKVHGTLLRALLRAAWAVHRSMCRYLGTHDVDRVYVFNGRFATMRAVLRACQEKGVECFTHDRGRDLSRYILLRNTTIHDIPFMHDLIWDTWNAAGADSDREAVARAWYEARDRGEVDDGFVREQRAKRLPADWDNLKRNITIFVSSEDEFASISDAWRNPLYDSQIEGILAIIDSLEHDPADLHLYLRPPPNLASVDHVQTRDIAKLAAPFLTCLPPPDRAHPPDLVDGGAGDQGQALVGAPLLPGHPHLLDRLREPGVNHELAVAGEPAGVGRDGLAHQVSGGVPVVGHGAGEEAGHLNVIRRASGVAGADGHVPGRRFRVVQGAPGEDGPLGNLAADLQHLGEHRGHVDRYLLTQGLEPQVEPVDVVDLAVVVNVRIFQDGPDDVHALPQPLSGTG